MSLEHSSIARKICSVVAARGTTITRPEKAGFSSLAVLKRPLRALRSVPSSDSSQTTTCNRALRGLLRRTERIWTRISSPTAVSESSTSAPESPGVSKAHVARGR